ncbi:methyltransferase FkbM family protein [Hymenobacter qilianensis]|uniref:Methyltransferase FkbM family protein n=2 Tax=Hymenobacter qilianensis TaxID=1385715 RepID=A0ACB5PT63_9BACT|nr:FkbM family methyltransferase [Hymenobacter qilianensis]QNP52641.1 FkbM family methyltransferase [Hymenobacter qilianensis]GGF69452.1 methyltransferase FkbM family protein [Hymenobacter qilianensis]
MNLKSLLHRTTIGRYNYVKNFKPIGITFEEYSDYIYKGLSENRSGFTKSKIFGVEINRIGTYSFIQNVEEVLIDEVYKFKADKQNPYIIDCGVNIGLSVIYFKRLYPNAKIVGFEPDDKIYEVCKGNLKSFGFTDVVMHNAAVWNTDGELSFLPNNSLGGMVVSDDTLIGEIKKVKAVRLKNLLREKVDFLKIDIEGAELEVLADCQSELKNVELMFVEYHSSISQEQELDKLLKIMTDSGFRYYIKHAWDYMEFPFIDYKKYNSSNIVNDLQLNIFAYRSHY